MVEAVNRAAVETERVNSMEEGPSHAAEETTSVLESSETVDLEWKRFGVGLRVKKKKSFCDFYRFIRKVTSDFFETV